MEDPVAQQKAFIDQRWRELPVRAREDIGLSNSPSERWETSRDAYEQGRSSEHAVLQTGNEALQNFAAWGVAVDDLAADPKRGEQWKAYKWFVIEGKEQVDLARAQGVDKGTINRQVKAARTFVREHISHHRLYYVRMAMEMVPATARPLDTTRPPDPLIRRDAADK